MKKHKQSLTNIYKAKAIPTHYWRPGTDYTRQIIKALKGKLRNGDIVAISEKAIATASGNIIDESRVQSRFLAKFLAGHWMPVVWGNILGTICHLRKKTVQRFRIYPVQEGSKHKQVALGQAGLLQALMHGSEGAIDGSNLPYSYVSLPLKKASCIADQLRTEIVNQLGTTTTTMIIDTDKTYSFRNFHFTPRPKPIKGIWSLGGVFAYVAGRFLRLKQRATPVGLSGSEMTVEEALRIAETANRARGFGAGRNVWEMAEAFDVNLTDVTWEMLDKVEHKPIVIVRRFVKNTLIG